MIGIALIIYGLSIAMFGYVLTCCNTSNNTSRHSRVLAQITEIHRLNILDLTGGFFKITATYLIDTELFTYSFLTHSPVAYEIGDQIELRFNPQNPSHILSRYQPTKLSLLFPGICLFGIVLTLLGFFLHLL